MRVVIFGASGMIGQGVLLACLRDGSVEGVLAIGRSRTGREHPKLREVLVEDLFEVASYTDELTGLDACFFCLGVTSAGMKEAAYRRITCDLTLRIAHALAERNASLCFVYVSGAGTDSKGRSMWARVKGETENAIERLFAPRAYLFRPGFIQPLDGIRSRTRSYRYFYIAFAPVLPLLRRAFPRSILTTREIARAMLSVARNGWPRAVLEAKEIYAAATRRR